MANNDNANTGSPDSITRSAERGPRAVAGRTVEVLYQKMGDRWFAFSLIDDEVFVGSITQDEIGEVDRLEANAKTHGVAGNS